VQKIYLYPGSKYFFVIGAAMQLEKEKDKKGKDIPAAREKNRRVEFKIIK
jgi:hypothetical protein